MVPTTPFGDGTGTAARPRNLTEVSDAEVSDAAEGAMAFFDFDAAGDDRVDGGADGGTQIGRGAVAAVGAVGAVGGAIERGDGRGGRRCDAFEAAARGSSDGGNGGRSVDGGSVDGWDDRSIGRSDGSIAVAELDAVLDSEAMEAMAVATDAQHGTWFPEASTV